MSSPLAATSVARSTEGEEDEDRVEEKAERARVRAAGGRCPWRECSWTLDGNSVDKTCTPCKNSGTKSRWKSTHTIEIINTCASCKIHDKVGCMVN
jgi:hypothetical protein